MRTRDTSCRCLCGWSNRGNAANHAGDRGGPLCELSPPQPCLKSFELSSDDYPRLRAASSGRRLRRGDRGRRRYFIPSVFLLCLFYPGGECLLAHGTDCNRHKGVVFAAQLRALTVIDTLPRRREPSLVDAPRNGVDLDAE